MAEEGKWKQGKVNANSDLNIKKRTSLFREKKIIQLDINFSQVNTMGLGFRNRPPVLHFARSNLVMTMLMTHPISSSFTTCMASTCNVLGKTTHSE